MRMLRTAIVAIALLVASAGYGYAQYPEYFRNRPVPGATHQAYSMPNFGDFNPRWAAFWNMPGYFAVSEPVPDNEYPIVADEGDGIAYDAHLIPNARVSDGKVFFTFDGLLSRGRQRYFLAWQTSADPRLTNCWMAFCADSAGSLWQAVERAAVSEEYPQITRAIIRHMAACGFVDLAKVSSMTVTDIRRALVDYTDVALAHNAARTRALVGRERLTQDRFANLRVGDRLELYYRSRFGPTPHKCETLVVAATGDTLKLRYEGYSSQVYWYAWDDLERIASFVAVRR